MGHCTRTCKREALLAAHCDKVTVPNTALVDTVRGWQMGTDERGENYDLFRVTRPQTGRAPHCRRGAIYAGSRG
jgi:hypothetical protein